MSLSTVRCQLLNKNWDEESKSEFSGLSSFNEVIAFMGADKVAKTFRRELKESFTVAKTEDDSIKAKKSAAGAEDKKKAKKNAAPPPPPGI